ncbi:MAG: hypothetical protein GY835_02240 [bacterium]|nr:hypothetical protein [bacterium]
MRLIRLSGHSGAGKSRLVAALPGAGVACPRAILYTSRPARQGEVHGQDYYFLSRAAIADLPQVDFLIGPVHDMLQAVDLDQLEHDLKASEFVLIEIFHELWPGLLLRLSERVGAELQSESVFMTAVSPTEIEQQADDEARADLIRSEVTRILEWRGKDKPEKIPKRAESAVGELAEALSSDSPYSLILHSAPEGPDNEDEWTRMETPDNRAAETLDEFRAFAQGDETS